MNQKTTSIFAKKSLLSGIFYYKTMNKGNFSESIDSWNIIKWWNKKSRTMLHYVQRKPGLFKTKSTSFPHGLILMWLIGTNMEMVYFFLSRATEKTLDSIRRRILCVISLMVFLCMLNRHCFCYLNCMLPNNQVVFLIG